MEDAITAMEEKIEARQHVLFNELNSEWASKQSHIAAWEFVAGAVKEVEQKDKTVVDIKKKFF